MKIKFSSFLIVVPIIVFIGGVFAFAENSVPGNPLYRIKISISEPVAGIFSFPKEEKAEWEERLVERRLKEVEKLVSADNFTETLRIDIEKNITDQVSKFKTNISGLTSEKDGQTESSDLNLRLRAALSAYQNIIGKISEKKELSENTKKEVSAILGVLANLEQEVTNNPTNIESSVEASTQNSSLALEKQNSAKDILNSTKLLYQKNRFKLSVNIQNKIDDKLATAEEILQEGKTFITLSDYNNAVSKFQSTIELLNEIKLSILSNLIKEEHREDDDLEIDEWGDD